MPWTSAQKKLAQAVAHGFKPTGNAKGFTEALARQVLEESAQRKGRPKMRGRLVRRPRYAP